jgi:hypothetical protein
MATSTYLAALEKALRQADIPDFSAGASGYFDAPSDHLDPALFEGDHIKPEIRRYLVNTLFRFWTSKGYKRPEDWTVVWIAGSGVSYQWAGNRGNGDLDVLMGIDWPKFYRCNPDWNWQAPEAMTNYLDNELRSDLWPRTEKTNLGGKVFEATFFVNQAVSDDLKVIHPYAAYNLTHDTWDVRPSVMPFGENETWPHDWDHFAAIDSLKAKEHTLAIQILLERLPNQHTAEWLNWMTLIEGQTKAAADLLEDIHQGRRAAFQPNGHGYSDYHNYRWQAAKKHGLVSVLGAIERARKQAIEAAQTATYSAPLATADEMITRAAMAHRDMR